MSQGFICSICLSGADDNNNEVDDDQSKASIYRYCDCETGHMHADCLQKWIDAASVQAVDRNRLFPLLPFAIVLLSEANRHDRAVFAHLSVRRQHTFDQARFLLAERLGWLSSTASQGVSISTLPRSYYEWSGDTDAPPPLLHCTTCLRPFNVSRRNALGESNVLCTGRATRRILRAFWRCFGHLSVCLIAFVALESVARLCAGNENGLLLRQNSWYLCVALLECMAFGEATMTFSQTGACLDTDLYDWRDVQSTLQQSVCSRKWQQKIVENLLPRDTYLFPELTLRSEFAKSFTNRCVHVQHARRTTDKRKIAQDRSLLDRLYHYADLVCIAMIAKILYGFPMLYLYKQGVSGTSVARSYIIVSTLLALYRFLRYCLYLYFYYVHVRSQRPHLPMPAVFNTLFQVRPLRTAVQ